MFDDLLKETEKVGRKQFDLDKLVEAVQSAKLQQLVQATGDEGLLGKIYKLTELQLDKIPDESVNHAVLPEESEEEKSSWSGPRSKALRDANIYADQGLVFWVTTKEKKSPSKQVIPAGLIAVTEDGRPLYTKEGAFTRSKPEGGMAAPRGLANVDRLTAFADEVYQINPKQLSRSSGWGDDRKPGLGTSDIKRDREEARSGALALKDPAKIAQWNQAKYKQILAKRRPSEEVMAVATDLNDYVKAELSNVDVSKAPGAKVRAPGVKSRDGGQLPMQNLMREVAEIWRNLDYAQDAYAEYVQYKEEGEGRGDWSLKRHNEYIERAKKDLEELKSGQVRDW